MSDIVSLTSQVQQLGGSVDRWGNAVNWLIAATAFVGVMYFMATVRHSTLSKRLRDAQELLLQAKDRELQSDLKTKDVEIGSAKKEAGTANEAAGKANERASANEKEAARLKKAAEDERMARVRLEKEISPRRLTGTQKETISKFLLLGHPWKVAVVSVILDGESEDFADDLAGAISASPSKWETMRIKNHLTTRHGVEIAWIEGTEDFRSGVRAASRRLGDALNTAGIDWASYVVPEKERNTTDPEFQIGVLYLLINRKPPFTKP